MASFKKNMKSDTFSSLSERLDTIERTLRLLLVHFVLNEAELSLLYNVADEEKKVFPEKKKSDVSTRKKTAIKSKSLRGVSCRSLSATGKEEKVAVPKKKVATPPKKSMAKTKTKKELPVRRKR